jgi:general secretion pathway protein E
VESLVSQELSPLPNRIARIHHSFFQKNGIVPLGCRKKPPSLVIAVCEDEKNANADVLSIFSSMPIEKKYVTREDFFNYLNLFREEQGKEVVIGVVEDLGENTLSEIAQELPTGHDLLDDAANEPPIIKLVNLLFSIAVKDRASDIHVQPLENDLRVRFRSTVFCTHVQASKAGSERHRVENKGCGGSRRREAPSSGWKNKDSGGR